MRQLGYCFIPDARVIVKMLHLYIQHPGIQQFSYGWLCNKLLGHNSSIK